LEQGDISIYEDAGATTRLYTDELQDLFAQEFQTLIRDDFILHRGVSTCLFACPPLGLYTHGYEIEAVEPVVRFYISKLFQRWTEEGLKCSPEQTAFFERHKDSWQQQGSKFMQFTPVSPTGS
jgi:hypothetical protein